MPKLHTTHLSAHIHSQHTSIPLSLDSLTRARARAPTSAQARVRARTGEEEVLALVLDVEGGEHGAGRVAQQRREQRPVGEVVPDQSHS